jgi:hypothetical protein
VDLHPAGAIQSYAYAAHAGQQVGYAHIGSLRASLWSGTPASWVNLHPTGAFYSRASGVYAGQQVGYAAINGVGLHASLWTGTAASWVDLHPGPGDQSDASDVYAGQQVGYANVVAGGPTHAGLWRGTPASWVDLHAFLPTTFSESVARGIWSDEAFTYVVGYGRNTVLDRIEALMWVGPPPCRTDFNYDGALNSQDFFDFLAALFAGTPDADFNRDGSINSGDFFDFLTAFFAGCA